jgi:DNA-binding SARP family transcriptional activator
MVDLLGPIEVRVDGVPVDLGGPQQRAVVAHLALEAGHVVSVERLIDRLWGDDPPRTPLGTLQSYVSRLRRALEPRRPTGAAPELLVSEAPGYVLRVDPEQVDVHRFRSLVLDARRVTDAGDHVGALARLDAALALWRGPALAGIGNDDVVRPLSVRLDDERAAATDDRFEALLALGRHQDVVPQLQAATDAQPLHERRWALLALALYRSSRQADALRALSRAREVLIDELGLDPGPELRELERRILAQDPALLLEASAVRPPAAPVAAVETVPAAAHHAAHPDVVPDVSGSSPASPELLVGRAHEWHALTTALTRAAHRPGLVLVEGEPGSGKSTLGEAFLEEARRQGWVTVSGRCLEAGLAPTLWPFVEIARELVALHSPADDDLDPAFATWVRLATGKEVGLATVEVADHLVAVLAATVTRAGATGCVVAIDDLHWADQATLDLLQVVLTRLDRAGVLVVAATRPPEAEPGSSVGAALAGLHRSLRDVTRVRMEPLDAGAVAELIGITTGVVPSDEIARRVQERAGGNPLFVTELARLVGERGFDDGSEVPAAVRDVVRSRLAALPERAIAELEVAAVLGERFSVRTVMAASERDADACLDALDAAIVTRILVPDGHDYRFAHALVRDAVVAGLPALRTARLHHRAAEALLAVHGDVADVAEPVAHHRLASSMFADPVVVAHAAARASDVARWRNALDTAEWFVARAAQVLDGLPRTAEVAHADFAVIEAQLGALIRRRDPARMAEFVDWVARHAEATNSDAARSIALFLSWGDVDTTEDLLEGQLVVDYERIRRLVDRTSDDQALVNGNYMLASYELMIGRLAEADAHVRASLAATGQADPDTPPPHVPLVLLPLVGAVVMALRDDAAEARIFAHRRLRSWLSQRAEVDPAVRAAFAFTSGLVEVLLGEPRRALEHLEVAVTTNDHGFIEAQGGASAVLTGWARAMTGDPSGVQTAVEGLSSYEELGERSLRPTLRAIAAHACLEHGDARGLDLLDAAEADATSRHEVWWLPEIVRLRAVAVHRADGTVEPIGRAAELLDRAEALAQEHGSLRLLARVRATRPELGLA